MRKSLSILSWFASAVAAGTAAAQPAAPEPAAEPVADPISQPPPAPAPEVAPAVPPASADVKPAGKLELRSEDDKYSAKVSVRLQPFFTLTRLAPEGGTKDYRGAFELRRARLTLSGNLRGKELTYKFQTDFGKGFLTLKDFHADVLLADQVWFRFGQYKRPFSRQQITSSTEFAIPERSITDRAFGAGRDIGIALRNNYEKAPPLEWSIGLYNGTGDTPRFTGDVEVDPVTGEGEVVGGGFSNVPVEFKPALVARVGLNSKGLEGYSEVDFDGGPLRWGVGASVWLEGDFDGDDRANQKLQLDYVVKVAGFTTTGGVYAMTDQTGPNLLDASSSLLGFHLQAGYMVIPAKLQFAARYALLSDRLEDLRNTDAQELSLGGNRFFSRTNAMIQGGLRFQKAGDGRFTDTIVFELGANVSF